MYSIKINMSETSLHVNAGILHNGIYIKYETEFESAVYHLNKYIYMYSCCTGTYPGTRRYVQLYSSSFKYMTTCNNLLLVVVEHALPDREVAARPVPPGAAAA